MDNVVKNIKGLNARLDHLYSILDKEKLGKAQTIAILNEIDELESEINSVIGPWDTHESNYFNYDKEV